MSAGSGICSGLCPKILLRAQSGRSSCADFRGWRELLLLPKAGMIAGKERGGVGEHKQDSYSEAVKRLGRLKYNS